MAIDGTLVMNPFLYSKLAYDPFKDFVPVSLVALVPSALVGNINIPVNSIKDLVEQEKAKPGTFQIGISTPTSQVNVGLLNMMAGTNFTMVPYRGGTTQITGILAGDIPLGMESINVSLPLWRDKKLKILGLVERAAAFACARNSHDRRDLPGLRPRHLAEHRRARRHAARDRDAAARARSRRCWRCPRCARSCSPPASSRRAARARRSSPPSSARRPTCAAKVIKAVG